jgi:hypothetical protein
MQRQSTLTCPKCSFQAVETMPTDACQFLDDCKGCGERLKPSRAIAACSALTAQCRVRGKEQLALLRAKGSLKCREALKARSAIRWNIKRVDHARQGREASPVRRAVPTNLSARADRLPV